MTYVYIAGELILLFLLSQLLTRSLSSFFYHLTRKRKMTVYVLAFVLLPGTFIHELAHLCMAVLLRVPAGKMKLFPETEGNTIKLGSVMIERTDPIRRMCIGVAPFLIGTTILISSLYTVTIHFQTMPLWLLIVFLYTIFEIGNTMFSSRKDLEGTIELVGATGIICGVLYFLGFRIPISFMQFLNAPGILRNVQSISFLLLIPLGMDLGIISIVSLLRKMLHR